MSRVFEELQIFGWDQKKENLLLSTILTGDRALLISQPGAAKTILPEKIAKALGFTFAPFDLNAVSFDDILGVPNIPLLQSEGKLEYIKGPGTIWGKQFVTYEEINRCKPAIQGKILEHLRGGTICGLPTGASWCWANMNPMGHAGANKLTPAIIGRFSLFVWAPEAIEMTPDDRAKIARVMTSADAPALPQWMQTANLSPDVIKRTQDLTDYVQAGQTLHSVLSKAATYWPELEEKYSGLDSFLAIFSDLLYSNMQESKDDNSPEPVALNGRRLAMIRRAILANRAIEMAMDAQLGVYLPRFDASIQTAVNAAIPIGINDEEPPFEAMRTHINQAVRQAYHRIEETDSEQARLQYQLFCSRDPVERARILLSGKLTGAEVINTGWQRIATMNDRAADTLAFVAVQLDARCKAKGKDGILPDNVLDTMKGRVKDKHVNPELPKLPGQLLSHLPELNTVIQDSSQSDPLMGLIAIEATHQFVHETPDGNWVTLQSRIKDKQREYETLMQGV